MASVSDSSLLTAAQEIVTEFMDSKTSLNDGVIKKAADLGLNSDQTQRLIERTNTEAFLRVYPEDTEFDVASPEVILGVKTASARRPKIEAVAEDDGLFKAASVKSAGTRVRESTPMPIGGGESYREKVASVTEADIFGMDEEFMKKAHDTRYKYAIDRESQAMCRTICNLNKTASELQQEQIATEEKIGAAIDGFEEFVKQAALSGRQSLADSEYEVSNMYPDSLPLINVIYGDIATKLAAAGMEPEKLERANFNGMQKWAHTSELTERFNKLLEITV